MSVRYHSTYPLIDYTEEALNLLYIAIWDSIMNPQVFLRLICVVLSQKHDLGVLYKVHHNLLGTLCVLCMGRYVCCSMYKHTHITTRAKYQLSLESCEIYLNLEPLGVSVP